MKKREIRQHAVTPEQAAFMFGLNAGTLANMRCAKRGPKYHVVGRKILYFVEDIESWIRQNPVLTRDSLELQI